MQASSKNDSKELDKDLNIQEKPKDLKKTKMIGVTLTLFEFAQVESLVEAGLSNNPSSLTKKALIKFIWENEHLLPPKPIKAINELKWVQKSDSDEIDKITNEILSEIKNPTDEDIRKARNSAYMRLKRKRDK